MKQIACVVIALSLITWILLSSISGTDYGYDSDNYDYHTQHDNDYEEENEDS